MSIFAQRHYQAIADVLADAHDAAYYGNDDGSSTDAGAAEGAVKDIEDRLVKAFSADNPRFKESLFRKAANR